MKVLFYVAALVYCRDRRTVEAEIDRLYDGKHEDYHNYEHTHIKRMGEADRSAFFEFYTHCVNKRCAFFRKHCENGVCGEQEMLDARIN
jgi:hypothetical protein